MKLIITFFLLSFIFGVLEKSFPLKTKQKRFREGWLTDITHFFINHFFVKLGAYMITVILYTLFSPLVSSFLQERVVGQPSWLQFIEAFLIAELSFYLIHRLAHTLPCLWNFHAIHHSSTELDWLAAVRFHPLDIIIANLAVGMPLFWLGFTEKTFEQYLIFGAILTLFNHANICLRFPILRWIIATPEFHHWHHSKEQVAYNKNFSGFPLIDLLFGTFYLPKNQMPSHYGGDEFIPQTYWKQIIYPLTNKASSEASMAELSD